MCVTFFTDVTNGREKPNISISRENTEVRKWNQVQIRFGGTARTKKPKKVSILKTEFFSSGFGASITIKRATSERENRNRETNPVRNEDVWTAKKKKRWMKRMGRVTVKNNPSP